MYVLNLKVMSNIKKIKTEAIMYVECYALK